MANLEKSTEMIINPGARSCTGYLFSTKRAVARADRGKSIRV